MLRPAQDLYGLNHQTTSVDFAMAYGSGVKPQLGREEETLTLDMVIAVDNIEAWHKANRSCFPEDYSRLGQLVQAFPGIRRKLQQAGSGIWYHPDLEMEGGQRVKYGVMETQRLVNDLLFWKDIYVAGRMHKPIDIRKMSPTVRQAQGKNLANALRVGLLLSEGGVVHERDLLLNIAGISYKGDTRKNIAGKRFEKPGKVESLVDGNLAEHKALYAEMLAAPRRLVPETGLSPVSVMFNGDAAQLWVNDDDDVSRALASELPIGYSRDLMAMSRPEIVEETLLFIATRVKAGSWAQTLKGGLTAHKFGVPYAWAKYKKGQQK